MPRYLICNADDFGMTQPITDAILDCHEKGIVSSTTLMANMPDAERACRLAQDYPRLGVGVHLTLTQGRPVLSPEQVPDLVGENGDFLPVHVQIQRMWRETHLGEQVEKEYLAQIQRARDLGIEPTHCDSHHGSHKRPVTLKAMLAAIAKSNVGRARTHLGFYWTAPNAPLTLKLRRMFLNLRASRNVLGRIWIHRQIRSHGIRTPDRMIATERLLPADGTEIELLCRAIHGLSEGISELITHPSYPDETDTTRYAQRRLLDRQLVTDPAVLETLQSSGVQLINFRDV